MSGRKQPALSLRERVERLDHDIQDVRTRLLAAKGKVDALEAKKRAATSYKAH